MSQLTIDIPSDVRTIMDKYPEIDWKEIAQQSVQEYATRRALADQLVENSEFTEEDAIELDKRIKAGLARRYGIRR